MKDETIKVRATDSGQLIDVVVYSKREGLIEIIVGEGVHSTKCELKPTSNGFSYAGNVLGREIVYERTRQQVQDDLDSAKPSTRRR